MFLLSLAWKRNCNVSVIFEREAGLDSTLRTFIKALVWNVMGLIVMSLVGFAATGSFAVGGAMAAVNTGIGFVNYLAYERIWARIRWGRHV